MTIDETIAKANRKADETNEVLRRWNHIKGYFSLILTTD